MLRRRSTSIIIIVSELENMGSFLMKDSIPSEDILTDNFQDVQKQINDGEQFLVCEKPAFQNHQRGANHVFCDVHCDVMDSY